MTSPSPITAEDEEIAYDLACRQLRDMHAADLDRDVAYRAVVEAAEHGITQQYSDPMFQESLFATYQRAIDRAFHEIYGAQPQ